MNLLKGALKMKFADEKMKFSERPQEIVTTTRRMLRLVLNNPLLEIWNVC